ncbi:MICOS complex subunit MIC13 [Microcaecilia unicolor]|uniref:MICOS complex subunit MIC13 n=1 Tax=Microcaecilia unicolor TaxID=1415580 RepID=A0A6P7Z602_9AMPH|nr:MICOS complex subunit MIC13 [Microcaecilia unicolor]
MGSPTFELLKLITKLGLAGGAMYVAQDQGLLGSSSQAEAALQKAKAALPPAVQEWADNIGVQIPAIPKFNFSLCESWNWGVDKTVSAFDSAPHKITEYTQDGWNYLKDLVK